MTGLFFFRNTRSHRVCAMWLLAGIAVGFAQDRDVRSARHIELKTERQRWAALADAKRLSQQAEKYEKQGKPDQAERMAEEALAMEEQVRGPRHIDLAHRLDQVADLYAAHGKDRAAEPLYQRARAIRERALSTHPDVYEQDGGELRVRRNQPADKVGTGPPSSPAQNE